MEIKVIYRDGDKSVEILIPIDGMKMQSLDIPTPVASVFGDEGSVDSTPMALSPKPTFNTEELAESEKYEPPSFAHSTAAAEAFSTAPAVTQVVTSAASVPPPPVPSVEPPSAPAVAVASHAELDSAGVPWDVRIHSSARSKVADGTWKLKRGIDREAIGDVQTQNAAVMAIPPPPQASTGMTFAMFMQSVSPKVTAGEMTAADIIEACKAVGLAGLPDLAKRPDLVESVAAALGVL